MTDCRFGHVALVGRPNAGKSTLFNRLIGQKVSITAPRAQTTRDAIYGIATSEDSQIVYIDTPGFQLRHGGALNRALNRKVEKSLAESDAIVFVIAGVEFRAADREVLKRLPLGRHVILAINKLDRIADRKLLLPFIQKMAETHPYEEIVPVSAKTGEQVEALSQALAQHLPAGERVFGSDELTLQSERSLAAELLREKLTRALAEELPYSLAVAIDAFKITGGLRTIHAIIIVDKPSQKAIVIGAKGKRLKAMASHARADMERLFQGKVFLRVWVKVKKAWMEDERQLTALGYG
ncbi:MAG TPA: GTPase Era [Burkholderiales bacterium]|nr:GTPase Era [Burkholderiales bacterium]